MCNGHTFNLISTPWLSVIRASGQRDRIRPADLTDGIDSDPILDVDFPRADFRGAALEFLIGLLTVAAIKLFTPPKRLIAVAKHPTQRDLARKLGADQVITPSEVFQRIRFATGARRLDGMNRSLLLGGADITFECVGRADSLNDAVRFTREGGTVVVVGMPGEEKVDWAPIWQRELTVMGAYAYGAEPKKKGKRTFQLAIEAAPELHLETLTGPLFGLGEYKDAIAYAMSAGKLGAVKVAFDLRGLKI